MVFRQESNFYYLSGCTVPASYLIIAYQSGTSLAKTPSVELFIPKAEPVDLMWSVPPPSLDVAKRTHDVSHLNHPSAIPDSIATLIKAFPDALFHTLPRASPLFPYISEEYTQLILAPENENGAITDAYLLSALHHARLTKDEDEIALIRKANQISSRAHETVMRVLGKAVVGGIKRGQDAEIDRPLLPGEWLIEKEAEAEAIFVASCRREGSVYFVGRHCIPSLTVPHSAVHQAYLPIVAAANRASTLHYCCNDKEFAWGPVKPHDHQNKDSFTHDEAKEFNPQVLLIDAGCEWDCYASDITRTIPVGNGGTFTKEARAIYELVREMQQVPIIHV